MPAHSQAHYARAYGVSLATVKRIYKTFPRMPWDNPDFTGEFLAEKSNATRAIMLRDYLARTEPPDELPPTPPAPKNPGEPDPEDYRLELPADIMEGKGLKRELDALADIVAAARSEWARLESIGARKALGAGKRYQELLTVFKQVAKDAPLALLRMEDTLEVSDVEQVWVQSFVAVNRLIDNFAVRVVPKLKGLDEYQMLERIKIECAVLKEALAAGDFMAKKRRQDESD